jgi:hypothetical protein
MPSLIRFGGGPDPYVHPLVIGAVLVAGALILLLPRRHVVVPLLAASLLIPFDQVVLVGPLHWTMLRVLVLLGWVRVLAGALSGQRMLNSGFNAVDKMLIFWAGISTFNIVLLWHSSAALINQLGALYNLRHLLPPALLGARRRRC